MYKGIGIWILFLLLVGYLFFIYLKTEQCNNLGGIYLKSQCIKADIIKLY